jgi:hypothetical protein
MVKYLKLLIGEIKYFWMIPFSVILFPGAILKNFFYRKPAKSVYFIGNSYNAFYTLAESLRKNGWKAKSVSPDRDQQFVQNYHMLVDLSTTRDSVRVFLDIIFNYRFLHVYNRTNQLIYTGLNPFLKILLTAENLKKCGVSIIFTPSGCLDGSTSKEINIITGGLCNKCIWQGNDLVCNDKRNQKRINWIMKNCSLFSNEVDLPKKLSYSSIGLNLPLSPLNSEILNPKIIVPTSYKISKKKDEVLVFTAYGNENIRKNDQRDIKGKKYIMDAINRIIEEGYPVKHFHATSIPSKDMKYYQVQADIIVDQLNYGTIGSAAREGMMLGKLVVCHVSELVRGTNVAMRNCPAIDATEESIYEVLKKLVLMSRKERLSIGEKSRRWMLQWFDVGVCADRYGKILSCLANKESLHPESKFL